MSDVFTLCQFDFDPEIAPTHDHLRSQIEDSWYKTHKLIARYKKSLLSTAQHSTGTNCRLIIFIKDRYSSLRTLRLFFQLQGQN